MPVKKTDDRVVTKGKVMIKRFSWLAAMFVLLFSGAVIAAQQFPVVDAVADKVVQKYQHATCEQLWQEKAEKQGQPPPPREQEALQMLHDNPQMRAAFINRVARPVLTKMFECGMVP